VRRWKTKSASRWDEAPAGYERLHLPDEAPAAGRRAPVFRMYEGDIVISAITLAELQYGVEADPAHRQQNEQALAALLEDIRVVPFDQAAAQAYGPVRLATRERKRTRWTS
jgi:predicted nucleic acid-binding protein